MNLLLRSVCLVVVVTFLTAAAAAQPNTGRFAESFDNGGVTSVINYYIPEDYDSTKTYPLFFAWHGAGMAGSAMRDVMYVTIAQRIKAIVVAPDANNLQTNEQLNALIGVSYNRVHQLYSVDTTKRIITGFSWGGQLSFQVGLQNPLLFNGIIGFAPAIGTGQMTQTMWDNIGRIRMATILGDQDFNYTPVDQLMKEIPNRGGALLYIVKPGVEHVDNTYFNSQEFRDDYARCYDYVLGITTTAQTPASLAHDIRIAPNPARDFVRISVDATTGETVLVELRDIRGAVVSRAEAVASGSVNATIPTTALPPGLYMARITAGSAEYLRKVLVVR
ncbi:MAG: T9SS type A sorting domain-containing protein [Bacteroidetes bacterium]|nr:T9SS type A sorting domain-containing protein [Bacteroidota bacterium]